MREYKVIARDKHITFYLSEDQVRKLAYGRFNLSSSSWKRPPDDLSIRPTDVCSLCKQFGDVCAECPVGKHHHGRHVCMAILRSISPLAFEAIAHNMIDLNKDGSVSKRTEAAFKKVRAFLLAGKRVAKRPKEA
ncbi:hypothetical protein ES703_102333 [subsurface metagenome]